MSATRTFLLELHCEEIPARFLFSLCNDMAFQLEAWAGETFGEGIMWDFRLHPVEHRHSSISAMDAEDYRIDNKVPILGLTRYSPRKLAWAVAHLPERQSDRVETQVGPPQRMCLDEGGKPTQTGLKFAEKWGVQFPEVRFEQPQGKKEPCAVVTLIRTGRPTVELLAEALPKMIASLHVPKAMRWGASEFEFVRPIRSILCFFGEDVVRFEVDGVKSGDTTWGHRLHHLDHPEPLLLLRPEYYESALEEAGVVVSFDARRERLAEQMDGLAAEVGGRVVEDDGLLDTLALIVEYPNVVRGTFPESFLDLPKEVLVTSLKEHQKSFCIEDASGGLLPYFLAAANRKDDPSGHVKAGNEWVLKARLYDARFFFAEDRKKKLITWLDKLSALTFQRKLGTYVEKTERIVNIAGGLADRLGLNVSHAREAARLCKADLRTLMVGEFPELQGVMGGEYLRHEGADEAVWRAVKEHYRPLGADDDIPYTDLGCVVSLADKLDTISGCIAVGLIPSGSKDPLALRRAGQGIVRILWKMNWDIDLMELVEAAWSNVAEKASLPKEEFLLAITPFLKDRVEFVVRLSPFDSNEIRNRTAALRAFAQEKACKSAIAARWSNLCDLKARCEALFAFAEDPRFASLAQSAKRIGNILKDEFPQENFIQALLTDPSEVLLIQCLDHAEGIIASIENDSIQHVGLSKDSIDRSPYEKLLASLAEFASPLESFFNSVMVKDEDPALRAARLSLLNRIRKSFLRVADFSLWQ
jgi:glycyl-tRNA synthetase beta chain